MSNITEIGFHGVVMPAPCKCHEGKFTVVVYKVIPVFGLVPCGAEHFDTEKDAHDQMEKVTWKHAQIVLKSMGLKVEDAVHKTESKGQQAINDTERLLKQKRETDTHLH